VYENCFTLSVNSRWVYDPDVFEAKGRFSDLTSRDRKDSTTVTFLGACVSPLINRGRW
jgi:hypothetical protein